MNINAADGLIGLLLLFGAWRGFKSGFVMSLYALVALVVEFFVASVLKDPIAALIAPNLPVPGGAVEPVAFLIAFSLAGLVLGIVGATVVRLLAMFVRRIPFMGALDKILGVIPGAIQFGLLAAGLVAVLNLFVPANSALGQDLRSSQLRPVVDLILQQLSRAAQ